MAAQLPDVAAEQAMCPSCQRKPADGEKSECRACLSLRMLVYRHVGSGALNEFTAEQKRDFFVRAQDQSKGSRYAWHCVRAVLISKTVERSIIANEDQVETASKPREVWLLEGYKADALDKCPTWTCPLLGEVVRVPVHKQLLRQIQESVEEKIMEKEKALRDAKPKAKAKAKAASFGHAPAEEQEPDLDVPEVPKVLAGPAPKSKPAAAAKSAPSEARAKAAADRQAHKQGQAAQSLAARAVGPLTAALTALPSLQQQLEREGLADMLEQLRDASKEFSAWKKVCTTTLQLADAGSPVAALPFNSKDLGDHMKSYNNLVKSARATLKGRKDRAAAVAATEAEVVAAAVGAETEKSEAAPAPLAKRRRVKGGA